MALQVGRMWQHCHCYGPRARDHELTRPVGEIHHPYLTGPLGCGLLWEKVLAQEQVQGLRQGDPVMASRGRLMSGPLDQDPAVPPVLETLAVWVPGESCSFRWTQNPCVPSCFVCGLLSWASHLHEMKG